MKNNFLTNFLQKSTLIIFIIFTFLCVNAQDFKKQKIVSCSAGNYHSMAIDGLGNLWAWGYNFDSQLGDGTSSDKTSPVQIKSGTKFKAVSAGYKHTLAIDESGILWVWGTNWQGQLGDGTDSTRRTPVQIKSSTKFKCVSAGYQYSMAIDESGSLWAWGENDYGQLGDGTTVKKSLPVQIKIGTKFVSVSARGVLAIDEAGNLWAWGYNYNGQLGDGTKVNKSIPVQIKPDTKFKSISAWSHSLVIDELGGLWACGLNKYGRLGDGTEDSKLTPVQIKVGTKFQNASAGYDHSLAIDESGNLWSWGANDWGELGNGIGYMNAQETLPIQIKKGTKFQSISAGEMFTLAIDQSGNIWVCGNNGNGELGIGSTKNYQYNLIKLNTENMYVSSESLLKYGIKAFGSTGQINIQSENSETYSVYNLMGSKVSTGKLQPGETSILVQPGIYIFSSGGCRTKVLVK